MEIYLSNVLSSAIGWFIAGVFVQAGLSKLASENHPYYVKAIEAYGVTPAALVPIMPRLIGIIEVSICILILLPMTSKVGLVLAGALLLMYLLVFAKQMLQGKADMNCGCAGPGADLIISPMLLLRNAVLVALCLFAIGYGTTTTGMAWLVVLPLALVLGLIYLSCDQLIANQQKIQLIGNS